MVFGNKHVFAVEIVVKDAVKDWVFGVFILWVLGEAVGDLEDESVDLKGCANWIRDFLENPRDRKDIDLFEMPKDRVFMLLCHSVMANKEGNEFVQDRFPDSFYRFHVSHLGMSSFDDVDILLLDNDCGEHRFIWQQGKDEVLEATVPTSEMRFAFNNAVEWFQSEQNS